MQVRVDVLGPLRLVVDGDEVIVPGPKRRALLAVLATAGGRAASSETLLDALWRDELPDTARATLQSHVSRLRRHLGSAADRLEGVSGGYRLDLGPDGTDLAQARELLRTARGADPRRARELLGKARALWRGDAFAEFADVGPLMATAVTAGELRRSIDEAFLVALVDVGCYEQAVEAATEHLADEPLSEPAVLALMRALQGLGRTADALRAGYEYRRRVITETGVEPTGALGDARGRTGRGGRAVDRCRASLPPSAARPRLRDRRATPAARQRTAGHGGRTGRRRQDPSGVRGRRGVRASHRGAPVTDHR